MVKCDVCEELFAGRTNKIVCSSACKRKHTRRRMIERKYGLTPRSYEALFLSQDGVCAICGKPKKLVVDHNHETGAVRGLLCGHCNTGIGRFADNAGLLERAIDYLQRNQ